MLLGRTMKELKYYSNVGTANQIEEDMVEKVTYNKANADLLFGIIFQNKNLLSDDEYINGIIPDSTQYKGLSRSR